MGHCSNALYLFLRAQARALVGAKFWTGRMEVDNRMSRAMEKGQHGEKQELKVEVPGTSKRSVSPHQHPESPSGRGATSGSIHSLRALEASVKRLASLSSKSSTYDPPDSSGHFLVTGQPFSGHNHAVPSEAVGSRSVPSRQGHWNKGASIDMSDDTFECFPGVTTPRGAGINVPSFHRSASFGSNARRGSATSCKSPGGSILRRACSEVHMQPPILALSWDVGNAKRQPSPMGERCASPELMSASKCQALQSPCIVRESGVSQRRRSIDFDLALCISKNSECEQFAKRNDRSAPPETPCPLLVSIVLFLQQLSELFSPS